MSQQIHKKAQSTVQVNQLIDLQFLKSKVQTRSWQFKSECKLKTEPTLSICDNEITATCKQCLINFRTICELKEQSKQLEKQLEILRIERDVVVQNEQSTMRQLTQEIERTKLQQRQQSKHIEKQLSQFIMDSRTSKNLQQNIQNKQDHITQLETRISEQNKINNEYADIMHKQYEFQINTNLKFTTLQQTIQQLQQLTNRYLKLSTCLQQQIQPSMELLLPNNQQIPKAAPLSFIDLEDMTGKLQTIQLSNLITCQHSLEELVQVVQEHLSQTQKMIINDISRNL